MDLLADIGIHSDYGSDLDDIDDSHLRNLLESIEADAVIQQDLEDDERTPVLRVSTGSASRFPSQTNKQSHISAAVDALHDVSSGQDSAASAGTRQRNSQPGAPTKSGVFDPRTPLERFRTAPKKPLSVTDLVSPAWCELQYWYSLTKYGRIKRSHAMKRGSEVHKELEEQVYTTVSVEVQTKEDAWALRIWNVIQGLRTLRNTGMTRELELWGTVEGQVINGIIDELSFTSTDPELEVSISNGGREGRPDSASDQAPITRFLRVQGDSISDTSTPATRPRNSTSEDEHILYLTDIKTRASSTLPNLVSMRPTHMQLMLYRKLLTELATNSVDAEVIFGRHSLESGAAFSDSLIAQLGCLVSGCPSQENGDFERAPGHQLDTVSELLAHNSLRQLWALMICEFSKTLPRGAASISKVLTTEYRSSRTSSIIGVKRFLYRDELINDYVKEEMAWWRGEREAKGVDLEEAFKCRICEFSETCTWRIGKIEETVQAARAKSKDKTKQTKMVDPSKEIDT